MQIQRRALTVVLALSFAAIPRAWAAQSADQLVVRDAWVREAARTDRASGGYVVIENTSTQPARLVAAQIEGVGVVELHLARMANETMSMEKVADITIPPNSRVELKPGSYHLMLFQMTKALEAGTKTNLTLRFANGVTKTVPADVRKRTMPMSQ